MTGAENTELGRLSGILEGVVHQQAQEHKDTQEKLGGIEKELYSIRAETVQVARELVATLENYKFKQAEELADMREHGTGGLRALAEDFALYKRDIHSPLEARVTSLEKVRTAAGAVESVLSKQRAQRRWIVGLAVAVLIAFSGILFNLLTSHHVV